MPERDVDYLPLELGSLCNARAGSIPAMPVPLGAPVSHPVPPPVGRLVFRGLPFIVGRPEAEAGAPDVVLLGGPEPAAMSVPVGANAEWLIFAHRLLETRVYEGAPVGGLVADYVLRYGDGGEERIPIRERFEIAFPDERWTQLPFLAWWDRDYELPPRLAGRWQDAGLRQAEMAFPGDVSWTLFPWRNPRPDVAIVAVEVMPRGPRFALGAITLSRLAEHPIRAEGARDVVVTLDHAPDAGLVFGGSGAVVTDAAAVADLRISVDRGIAGYPFALPASDGETFLADPVPGFGEAANSRPSPKAISARHWKSGHRVMPKIAPTILKPKRRLRTSARWVWWARSVGMCQSMWWTPTPNWRPQRAIKMRPTRRSSRLPKRVIWDNS